MRFMLGARQYAFGRESNTAAGPWCGLPPNPPPGINATKNVCSRCPFSGAQTMCEQMVPYHTLVCILMWLPPTEYDPYQVRAVCKRFWTVFEDDSNWRRLCEAWHIAEEGATATWRRVCNKAIRAPVVLSLIHI